MLGTVAEKVLIGDQPDQLTAGFGALVGVEFSQDASILSDFFQLLILPLDQVLIEVLDSTESTVTFVPPASSDRKDDDE